MSDPSVPSKVNPTVELPRSAGTPKQQRQLSAVVHEQRFSGPLPPPDLLRQYEQVCPGYADRILKTFERETEHRREVEMKVIAAQVRHDDKQFLEARFGQIFALIITLSAISAGVYTSVLGHEIAGSIIGIGGIGGIVGTFILGRAKHSTRTQNEGASPSDQNSAKGKPNPKRTDRRN